ncbi:O-acetylhomoserine aminocarboxypropyltransferase/cysteine synthase family protein [Desnuesiella massiliensis]|uniref:O-acetylhomoserine aminocarboxypropyltransferase/cysteine synthase family protein n=1 Tax=Desnuesiella massiliensis TaxID=1650662 RepID=UPI0006E3EDD6|nr:O-acetylhomoserine aminocarboxypropyltransferase/cysteine synthase family protein [Desnuesiella massiliensis]
MSKNWKLGTKCIQEGYKPKAGEPRILPIAQTVSYKFEDPEHLANLFNLSEAGHLYTRISNPTTEALENKYAALEEGVGAVAVSSGQSAILLSILNLCNAGDHIVSSINIYGGTFNLFNVTLKKLGIEVTFIDPDEEKEEILKLIRENTKAIYGETIGNPSLNILDFEKFAAIAEEAGIPFIIDNTLATPYICKPKEHGANIVVHSTTKYSDGHATSIGGIIIDLGNFNWDNGKFQGLVEPDESYHGLKYWNTFKEAAYITKLRVTLLRDLGCTMSPFNAFLTNLGLETLHLRMQRHSDNALALARWLKEQSKVSWVNYPLLNDNKHYESANKYLKNGASGILTFGIKGDFKIAEKFIKGLKLASLVVTLGDVRTYVIHPYSTTHRQLSEEEKLKSGATPELIRVSIGIEDIEDIIYDFNEAFQCI